MKVRTVKPHGNSYPPQYQKNRSRIYEPSDSDAESLIASGLVEKHEPDEADSQD